MDHSHVTFAVVVRSWTVNSPVTASLVAAAVVYLLGVRSAGRRDGWPRWRTACFLAAGLGGAAICTMSVLAVDNHTHLWALAAQLTLLVSLVPVGVALGDPVGLARAALGDGRRQKLDRVLAGSVVRVVTFPVVSAVLATTFLCVTFLSGVLPAALRHTAVMDGLYLAALVIGCLASLPLLGAELLPAWCTEPFRLLFAFVDGLVDALPGILVLTTGQRLAGGWFAGRPDDPNWDVHVAGALMLTLSEVVALPIFFLVFFRWAAHEGAFGPPTRRPPAGGPPATSVANVPAQEPELLRPWWETEGLGRGRRDD